MLVETRANVPPQHESLPCVCAEVYFPVQTCKQIPNGPSVGKKSERRLFGFDRETLRDEGILEKIENCLLRVQRGSRIGRGYRLVDRPGAG